MVRLITTVIKTGQTFMSEPFERDFLERWVTIHTGGAILSYEIIDDIFG